MLQNLRQEYNLSPRIPYFCPKGAVLLYSNPFIHGSLALTRQSLQHVDLYNVEFTYAQDYDLIIRLLMSGFRYKYLSFPFYVTTSPISSISFLKRAEQLHYAKYSRSLWRSYVASNPSRLFL